MQDQHPVSWLVKSLKPAVYPAVAEWIDDVWGKRLVDLVM